MTDETKDTPTSTKPSEMALNAALDCEMRMTNASPNDLFHIKNQGDLHLKRAAAFEEKGQ